METDPVADQPGTVDIQAEEILFHLIHGSPEIVDAVAEHIPESGVLCRPCPVVHIEIHVVRRGNPAGQILHKCQLRKPVKAFPCQLPFRRKDLVEQPFIQL